MKLIYFLTLFTLSISVNSNSQTEEEICVCDTVLKKLAPGTTRADSINWKSVECYYWRERLRGEPKSIVNYQNGVRHGAFSTYHRKSHWVFVKQRGYQQAIPRRRKKIDFFRKEGKSLFGKSISGNYVNGKMDGIWHTFDTNQRILTAAIWKEGVQLEKGQTCNGIHDTYGFDHRNEFDSIANLVKNATDGTYKHLVNGHEAISYSVKNHQLNGMVQIYRIAKNPYLRSQYTFENNCLTGSSITFSPIGDTSRIESNYRNGIAYTIVSFTPDSRGTAYYRDPRNSYELNSDYRNGLVIERREKSPRKK